MSRLCLFRNGIKHAGSLYIPVGKYSHIERDRRRLRKEETGSWQSSVISGGQLWNRRTMDYHEAAWECQLAALYTWSPAAPTRESTEVMKDTVWYEPAGRKSLGIILSTLREGLRNHKTTSEPERFALYPLDRKVGYLLLYKEGVIGMNFWFMNIWRCDTGRWSRPLKSNWCSFYFTAHRLIQAITQRWKLSGRTIRWTWKERPSFLMTKCAGDFAMDSCDLHLVMFVPGKWFCYFSVGPYQPMTADITVSAFRAPEY